MLNVLVPLSFIGKAAVSFYRTKIKVMTQLKMTEEQRKATLRDGQDAGEMLLDIEARIGELALKEPPAKGVPKVGTRGRLIGQTKSKALPKQERLGLPSVREMKSAESIHKHPDIVAKVKAQARENEDIKWSGQPFSLSLFHCFCNPLLFRLCKWSFSFCFSFYGLNQFPGSIVRRHRLDSLLVEDTLID